MSSMKRRSATRSAVVSRSVPASLAGRAVSVAISISLPRLGPKRDLRRAPAERGGRHLRPPRRVPSAYPSALSSPPPSFRVGVCLAYPRCMERASLTRLRWRLRGAWQWPTFGVLLLVDAVLLSVLPIAGDGPDAFAALVLALFFNLVAVGVLAPAFGWLWSRRRPDLPPVVARDRGGTVALVLVTAVLLGLGIGHHSAVVDQHEELAVQALVVARYVD